MKSLHYLQRVASSLLKNATSRMLILVLLVLMIPLTVTILNQQQNLRQEAASQAVNSVTATVSSGNVVTVSASGTGPRYRFYIHGTSYPEEGQKVNGSYSGGSTPASKEFYFLGETGGSGQTKQFTGPSAAGTYYIVVNAEGNASGGVASGCAWSEREYKKYYDKCTTQNEPKCDGYVEYTGASCTNKSPETFTITSGGSGSAPSAPTGVTATAGATCGVKNKISWNASSGSPSGYYVYRGSSSGFQPDGTNAIGNVGANETTLEDQKGVAGSSFYYKVGAWNNSGINYSNAVQVSCSGSGVANSYTPKGFLDSASCTEFQGWACDLDRPIKPIEVHFYKDGSFSQGGTYVGKVVADVTRSDVSSQCSGISTHGFKFTVPSSLKDGQSHQIYAHGINTDSTGANTGSNPLLQGVPKTISCTGTGGPPGGGTSQYAVQGIVYKDIDGDGNRDTNEEGFEGIRVDIFNTNGFIVSTDTTDSTGNYIFSLNAGTYRVRVATAPTGWALTTNNDVTVTVGPAKQVYFGLQQTTGGTGTNISVSSIVPNPSSVAAGSSGSVKVDVNGQASLFNVYLYSGPNAPDPNNASSNVSQTYDRNNLQSSTFYKIGYAYIDQVVTFLPPANEGTYYFVANAEAGNGTNSTIGCDWRGKEYTRTGAPGGTGSVTFTGASCSNSGAKLFQVTAGSGGSCTPVQNPVGGTCDQDCDCQTGLYCQWGGTNGSCKQPASNSTELSMEIVTDSFAANASGIQEQVSVQILSSTGSTVKEATGTLLYNPTTQTLKGTVDVGNLPTGNYTVNAKLVNSLRQPVTAGAITITSQNVNTIPQFSLPFGDANDDNKLDIRDFNVLYDCMNSLASCTGNNQSYSDFNKDSTINILDYNIFISNI